MLNISPDQRYTVDQCLAHHWFNDASAESLGDVAEAIKNFQAKKKLKGAILGVMAAGKMKNLLAALQGANAPAATSTTGGTTTAKPTTRAGTKPAHATAAQHKLRTGAKLEVVVLQGKDLAAHDKNGKSDPYLRLFYGQTRLKTTTKKSSQNPVWTKESFLLPFDERENFLRVECWDWELLGSDEFMGEFCVDVRTLAADTPVTKWHNLAPSSDHSDKLKKKATVSGAIQITVQKITQH